MALNFGKVNRSASFNPTSAFPLDARYYFETLAAAQAAAQNAVEVGSSEGTYFYGENLVVVESGKATLYLIQPDKTLTEVGSVPVGDGQSIEIVDGKVQMKGFGGHYYAYSVDEEGKSVYTKTEGFKEGLEPRVVKRTTEDGTVVTDEEGNPIFEIAWYEPSTTTVEGLSSTVDTLSKEVEGKADKTDSLAGYGIKDAYTKNETENVIAAAVASAGHLKREIVEELPAAADADPNTIYMIKVEGASGDAYEEYMLIGKTDEADGTLEQIGDTTVDLTPYKVKDADSDEFTIDENGVVVIKEIDSSKVKHDGETMDDVIAAIQESIDNKVDKNGTDRLITEEEANVIANVSRGDYDNFVKSVDEDAFAVDENGDLTLKPVDMAKVVRYTTEGEEENLADVIDALEKGKIEKIYLGETNETTALVSDDGTVVVPVATVSTFGVVRSSIADDGVSVDGDGYMRVNSLNVNKLTQTAGDTLILYGGSATA